MCSTCDSVVRRMLPAARLVVGLFDVVQLAVKMTGDVRRRVAREKYGRRGRSGDAEYGKGHAGAQPGAPLTRPARQDHGHPRRGPARPGDRRGVESSAAAMRTVSNRGNVAADRSVTDSSR